MATARATSRPPLPVITVIVPEIDQIVAGGKTTLLSDADVETVTTAVHAMAEWIQSHKEYRTSEKATKLEQPAEPEKATGTDGTPPSGDDKQADAPKQPQQDQQPEEVPHAPKVRPPGHGRHGAADFVGADIKPVLLDGLGPKCACPTCECGKLYHMKDKNGKPKCRFILRISACPPIQATRYDLEQLRCNLCGAIFTAPAPEGIGEEKWDASVASMLAVLKYQFSLPWYRMAILQFQLGVPLPESTQWHLLERAANKIVPVHRELEHLAAQGDVLQRDDTTARILDKVERPPEQDPSRTGLHTTGIVSRVGDHLVAVFRTGPNHAGENLSDILGQRENGLPAPKLMGDALSSNDKLPPAFKAVLCNCLTHARRQFVDIYESFPEQCRYVIRGLGLVYHHDDQARTLGLDDEQRLAFHQQHSGPVMERLRKWMQAQFEEGLVEPNSGLGKAINYFLKRWPRLTRFLEYPGAPLDSNLVERALKKAVLLRKNSLFFKTQHGADVADIYLTIIHTCELNGIEPFRYLTELQRHANEVRRKPADWLPWNYHLQLKPAPD